MDSLYPVKRDRRDAALAQGCPARYRARMDKLPTRILLGMLIGAALGAILREQAGPLLELARLLGTVFLRLLLVMVLPLAASALFLGILELEPKSLARLGGRLVGLTVVLTTVAVALGVGLVALIAPGQGMDRAILPAADQVKPAEVSAIDLIIDLFPANLFKSATEGQMVPVLVGAVLFALAMRRVRGPGVDTLKTGIEGLFDVCAQAIHMVLALAPVGVAALMFQLAAKGGLEAMVPLLRFVAVVLLGLGIQLLVVYPIALRIFTKRSPRAFFAAIRPAMAMAFSTASSAASLPTSLRVAEEGLRLPPEVARFVLTVGATGNQNGTALFEGVAVLFLAQLYGVDLSLAQQATVCGVAILGGVGTAGVPGGALPVIAALLVSVGVPVEAIGFIVGVDRLLDMCRTTLNVSGDLVIAAAVVGDELRA